MLLHIPYDVVVSGWDGAIISLEVFIGCSFPAFNVSDFGFAIIAHIYTCKPDELAKFAFIGNNTDEMGTLGGIRGNWAVITFLPTVKFQYLIPVLSVKVVFARGAGSGSGTFGPLTGDAFHQPSNIARAMADDKVARIRDERIFAFFIAFRPVSKIWVGIGIIFGVRLHNISIDFPANSTDRADRLPGRAGIFGKKICNLNF